MFFCNNKSMTNTKKKYGEAMKTVLMVLAGSAFLTFELLEEVFGGTKSVYKNKKRRESFNFFNSEENYEDAELQRFYSLLNRLKNQGFIKKQESKHGSLWNITKSGFRKLGIINNKKKKLEYELKADNKVKIIVFDIPEYERWKRDWLREALAALGFSMFQKSVWIGKNKIPEKFLRDLHEKKLLNYVHVLEVSASGTIKEI